MPIERKPGPSGVKNIAVIGAGPAGLTAAYKLIGKGHRVTLFEASDCVGGMAKTIELWGQLVDLGPHRFFSSDPRVNSLWLEAVGEDYSMVNRLTRIYYRKTFFDYPLSALNALKGLGPLEATRCVLSYLQAKLLPNKDETTFENWVSNRFGYRLYSIFFRSYSEKLWGVSCRQIDADFAAQRIKKLSLYEAIKSSLTRSDGKHRTLVDEFAYPNLGAGAVYNRMAALFRESGGVLQMQTRVKSVQPAKAGGDVLIRLESGDILAYDHVISTMPLTHLVDRMDAPEAVKSHARQLKFRNTILVYLLVDTANPFPDQWVYIHSTELKTGRITNFRNWVPHINRGLESTILCLEYWSYDDEEIWAYDQETLVGIATQEIYSTGLIPVGAVQAGEVVRVPKCYPVYNTGYREHLKPIEIFLREQNGLSVIGRYGAFKYNNQDHSILMGLLAAENVADGTSHDLWAINTDYEYQEASKIAATSLGNG